MSSSSELAEKWKIRFEQWRESDLSGAAWCRENNITYQVFLYWRKKLEPSQETVPSSESFVELLDSKNPHKLGTGIEVECQGVRIHLSKDFDAASFLRCLKLLRDI